MSKEYKMIKVLSDDYIKNLSESSIESEVKEKMKEVVELSESGVKIQVRYKKVARGEYLVIFAYDNELNRYYKKEEIKIN